MSVILSFVVPVKDEQDSLAELAELAERIFLTVREFCSGLVSELVFVDDGSTDNSWSVIRAVQC